MQITIKGKTLKVNDKEVALAKETVAKYIKMTKDYANNNNLPSYYYTSLIIMYIMSRELIGEMDENLINILYKAIDKARKKEG